MLKRNGLNEFGKTSMVDFRKWRMRRMTEQELKEIRKRLEAVRTRDDIQNFGTKEQMLYTIRRLVEGMEKKQFENGELLNEAERLRKENEKQKETLQQIEKWLIGTLANEDLTIVESKVLEITRKALKG
ncbi:hypothetical protein D1872_174120 [compost metagenome]